MKQLPIIAGYPPERIHKFNLRHGVTQSQGFVAPILLQTINTYFNEMGTSTHT